MRWPFARQHRDTLDEELRAHLALAEQDRRDRGESPADARARARREFGNLGLIAQLTREMRPWRGLDRLPHDLRVSFRRLWTRPTTTVAAIAMLGLAIGITTAMFTLVDAFVLRPLPFRDADRIGSLRMRNEHGGRTDVAPAVFRAWRDSRVFAAVEGATREEVVIAAPSGPVVSASAFVSSGMFDLLGVRPLRGRLFTADDGRDASDRPAVISEDLWRNVFAGAPDIIGRRIALADDSVLIVGILPREIRFPEWNTQVWRPIDYERQPPGPAKRATVYAKFRGAVPEADALLSATRAAHAADPSTAGTWAERGQAAGARYAGMQYTDAAVRLLMCGVGLVFVVLSANAGGLLLAHFNARRRDYSVCSALGASRARLLWQASLESTLLGPQASPPASVWRGCSSPHPRRCSRSSFSPVP
jgi:hypothetical protein